MHGLSEIRAINALIHVEENRRRNRERVHRIARLFTESGYQAELLLHGDIHVGVKFLHANGEPGIVFVDSDQVEHLLKFLGWHLSPLS